MPMKINVGDIVELKKQHPCGGKSFEVMRAGMDFRLRCQTCGAQVWLTRPNLEKRVRRLMPVGPAVSEADKK
jgi:hypothetical protein